MNFHYLFHILFAGDDNYYTSIVLGTEEGARNKAIMYAGVMNMKGMNGGEVIKFYKGPVDQGRYIYLLYKQDKKEKLIQEGAYNENECKGGRAW